MQIIVTTLHNMFEVRTTINMRAMLKLLPFLSDPSISITYFQ